MIYKIYLHLFIVNSKYKIMRFLAFVIGLGMLLTTSDVIAQETVDTTTTEVSDWKLGGGIGFDFAQLLQINPKPGAGDNRIGLGGLSNWFANYKKDNINWENNVSLQLSAQKVGFADTLFIKNLDVFRFNSKFGFKGNNEKLFVAAELQTQTLLLNTYEGNVLRNRDGDKQLIAKFLSPLTASFSPGLDYKPKANLSVFYSPISYKLIYVNDPSVAALNIHGNPVGEQSLRQMGSNLKVVYTNKFFEEKMNINSSLDLYSNYLMNPQNLDILWKTDINIQLIKNVSLNLVTELFYDDNVSVILDSTGEPGVALSFTEALLIKYNILF